ncbi:hypothetical protein [Kitasatospora sp. LaBMicrA B282]|uniref:hypothetical protein n=1 Tax=Kitasatospora sp. LaBMicrA B282 TaxID=3420949 RepID=UPI003D0D535F
MQLAFAVRVPRTGPAFAELVLEVGARQHADLVPDLLDSGFETAIGTPPATTASVQVVDGRVAEVVLLGGRRLLAFTSFGASARWLAAARGRAAVVVIVVPPGTWPPATGPDPSQAAQVTAACEAARAAGRVLHGVARLTER